MKQLERDLSSQGLDAVELLSMRREPAVPTKKELSRLRVGDTVKLAVRPRHRHFYWACLHTWFLVEELPTESHDGTARAADGFPDSPIQAGQAVSFGLHNVAAISPQQESNK
jgi:hypothetical protein